jgi:hypothetical protein
MLDSVVEATVVVDVDVLEVEEDVELVLKLVKDVLELVLEVEVVIVVELVFVLYHLDLKLGLTFEKLLNFYLPYFFYYNYTLFFI